VFLSCVFSAVIGLMAFGEALVLWLGGTDFVNKSSPEEIFIGDFSISANGEWAVSRICFCSNAQRGRVCDVVMHNLRDQSAVRLHVSPHRPGCVAVSPAADVVAIACWDGSIRIWNASPNHEAGLSTSHAPLWTLGRASEPLDCLAFSPDGGLLAGTGTRFTWVWRWPDGKLLQEWPHKAGRTKFLSFLRDSRRVLLPGPKGSVLLCDAYTGQTTEVISPHDDAYVVDAAVSPSTRLAAFADSHRKMRVHSLANNGELWRQATCGWRIAMSPDGRFLATDYHVAGVGGGWRISVCDACSGQHVCDLTGHTVPITRLVFASDGLLYSCDAQGIIRAWAMEEQRERWCFSALEWASNAQFFEEAPAVARAVH
jgi:WD40 repeat protein